MKRLSKRQCLILAILSCLSMIWQSCDPPPLPSCVTDALFTTSASITYYEGSNIVHIRILPPTTCAEEVFAPGACTGALLAFTVELIDCHDNTETLQQIVLFNNDGAPFGALNWSVNSTGGTVLGDLSVAFPLSAPSLSGPLKQVNISVNCAIGNATACSQPGPSDDNVLISSLNFNLIDGTPSPTVTSFLVFENTRLSDTHFLVFPDVIPSGC